MVASLEARRKKLLFRCHHMGTAENDFLFGRFADAHVAGLDARRLDLLESLLAEGDNDLFDWVTGRKVLPERHDNDLVRLIREFA
ncbi:MAG: succinate dehydrogenase assembly factor 2 [Magnetospirillum sp. WYHS-4]